MDLAWGQAGSKMFKLSKKADYGLIAVKHLAMHREQHACSANEIADEYGISSTLMAKVLQKLARQIWSQRSTVPAGIPAREDAGSD